ncbi:gp16 family protein [Phenylobacterium ferrooxidans]|uniref:Regulatory protein GemA n=1 Tax=Phenylobacterium ferrooxidans TaxID=2982689 RepID=A0ABW6CJU2_9CAUL
MTTPAFQASDRRALLAKIHLGAKDLGLDEDARRDVLEKITGLRSSADCTDRQLIQVLAHYREDLGWTPNGARPAAPQRKPPAPRSERPPAKHPVAKKARALWISLHQLGAVREPSERTLEAFAKRQLGVDRLQWADQSQGFRLIEALKQMAERAGWSQDLASIKPDRQVWTLKARLVSAQVERLGKPYPNYATLTEADLDRLARHLSAEMPRPEAADR